MRIRSIVSALKSGQVMVKFALSGVEIPWSQEDNTLLELAEEVGLVPPFGHRSGICGTCRTRILCGTVDYLLEPLAEHSSNEILLCCLVPHKVQEETKSGESADVILDL